MPELPEVETTARLVRPALVGRQVEGAQIQWLRTLGGDSRARFRSRIVGSRIASVGRRAKYIRLDLKRGRREAGTILVHLRMSGRLVVRNSKLDATPYTRVSLRLSGGRSLDFVDVRKFGRFQFHAEPEPALAHLGPEPLSDGFTAAWLHGALRGRRRAIKPLLLDQSFLAGLGNIYVDESLFRTRIHPLQRSDRISQRKAGALQAAIVTVLSDALEKQGSSFDTFYRTPTGQPGAYQDEFQVYGRQGKACRRCGALVTRLVVGQRGTHICPRCQRRPKRKA